MSSDHAPTVERAALRVARESDAPLLIAVSGGLDSMTLLHALARTSKDRIAAVATFDHGTGRAAARAVRHVERAARSFGLPVVVGRTTRVLDLREGRESAWRQARYAFLRETAAARCARIATAHTEDDQVETVLMRSLRGSGARGLSGLYAGSDVLRPFLHLRRAVLEAYATRHGVTWVDDPSNQSREFLRNRVRLDLLPAMRRVSPDIDAALLSVASRAAALRNEIEAYVDEQLQVESPAAGQLAVRARELDGLAGDSLMMLWGALAGRVGLSLDWRGTRRIGEFTMKQPRSGWIPLSGGWQLEARRGQYRLSLQQDRMAAARHR